MLIENEIRLPILNGITPTEEDHLEAEFDIKDYLEGAGYIWDESLMSRLYNRQIIIEFEQTADNPLDITLDRFQGAGAAGFFANIQEFAPVQIDADNFRAVIDIDKKTNGLRKFKLLSDTQTDLDATHTGVLTVTFVAAVVN